MSKEFVNLLHKEMYELQNEQLKQQIAELKSENERLNKALDMCKHIERYDIGDMLKENIQLKQQLKYNTKQICDKIRKEIVYYPVSQLAETGKVKANVWGISMKDIEKVIDQMEKGE